MKRTLLLSCLTWALSTSAQVPDYVPTEGLVAWYDCNGNGEDQSGQSPAIQNVGDAQWDVAGFLDFQGNGHADIPTLSSMTTPTWTIVARVKQRFFLWKGDPTYPNNVQIVVDIRDNYLGYAHAPDCSTTMDNQTGVSTAIGSLDDWQIVVVARDANGVITMATESGFWTFDHTPSCVEDSPIRIGAWWNNDLNPGIHQPAQLDYLGLWNGTLNEEQIEQVILEALPVAGCMELEACNYNAEANVDDGSCIPSGCMDDGACNYNADAECEGEACDYSCCPGPGCCGEGMHWDADAQTCVITPPSVAPDAECTLLNLQELAEGYQILLAENAELDSLLADCDGTSTSDQSGPCSGEDVVTYHGYDYDIVEIGDQCWFAENARFLPAVSPVELGSEDDASPHAYVFNYEGSNVDEAKASAGYLNYGAYYNFWAIESWSICPEGWKVPSDGEWMLLEQELGMTSNSTNATGWRGDNQGSQLKSTDSWGVNNGLNSVGMNCLPHGGRISSPDSWVGQGIFGDYWTASTIDADQSWYRGLRDTQTGIYRFPNTRERGLAVRCVKD